MKNIALLCRRELGAYLKSPMGYVIVAVILAIEGLLFNAFVLGGTPKLSAEVLANFFYICSGGAMFAGVFLSMRLIAEEHQTGTLNLLFTSPVKDHEIVLGKFCSALVFFCLMTLISIYMPLLIFVNGKVSLGHIFGGYLGVVLLGAASIAIGMFGSALAKSQVLAVILGGAMVIALLVFWLLGSITENPIRDVASYLALHGKHFQPFQLGVLNSRDVVYYLSVVYVFLLLTTHVLQARRWR